MPGALRLTFSLLFSSKEDVMVGLKLTEWQEQANHPNNKTRSRKPSPRSLTSCQTVFCAHFLVLRDKPRLTLNLIGRCQIHGRYDWCLTQSDMLHSYTSFYRIWILMRFFLNINVNCCLSLMKTWSGTKSKGNSSTAEAQMATRMDFDDAPRHVVLHLMGNVVFYCNKIIHENLVRTSIPIGGSLCN